MSKKPPPAPTARAVCPCPTLHQIGKTPRYWLVGCFWVYWLVGDSISVNIGPPSRGGRKRREKIAESKNVQTTPIRTYCKRNRPLPYYHPNCRTPRQRRFAQNLRTTRPTPPPSTPVTGNLPSTIASPDHPRGRRPDIE